MAYCNPPVATRFPVNRKNHTKKGPYLASMLKKMLKKKITFESPETQELIKGTVADALLWRLILNGTQGETHAIKEVIDRIDGKLSDVIIDQSQHNHITYVWETNAENSDTVPSTALPARDTQFSETV